MLNIKIIDGIKYKQCYHCKEYFIANPEYFAKDRYTKDQLSSRCKNCLNTKAKAIYKMSDKHRYKKYITWNDTNIKILKDNHNLMSNDDLAKLFNTSVGSIEAEAVRLKLVKSKQTRSKIHKKGQHNTGRKPLIIKDGFTCIYMPDHPYCDIDGYVREHRLVMEEILDRYLEPTEGVKHKNGNRADVRPENLEVFAHFKYDVSPMDVYNDRKNGMSVEAIKEKYHISNNTYYRKLNKVKKD